MILSILLPATSPPVDGLLESFADAVPRLALDPPHVWLDVRGMDAASVHALVRGRLRSAGVRARYGVGRRPVTALVAARSAVDERLVSVAGGEREFLAPHGLAVLGVEDPLLGWLAEQPAFYHGLGRNSPYAGESLCPKSGGA